MRSAFRHATPLYALCGTTAFVIAPLVSMAQGAAVEQGDQAKVAIEEIIVTARRREEPLQNVPASVYEIGQQEMFLTGNDSMGGLRDVVPNVNFGSDLPRGRA